MTTKPKAITFGILILDEVYDETTDEYVSELTGDQTVFEYVAEEYLGDEERQLVIRNTETNELWAIDTWYNGASWGDEPMREVLEDIDDNGYNDAMYRVEVKPVTVTKYVRIESE